jgi:hypothetical protein
MADLDSMDEQPSEYEYGVSIQQAEEVEILAQVLAPDHRPILEQFVTFLKSVKYDFFASEISNCT